MYSFLVATQTLDDSLEQQLQKIRQAGDFDLRTPPLVTDLFDPIAPHKVGVAHLAVKPRFLLADPVGCGKTPQVLVAFAFLKHRRPDIRTLVVARKNAIWQWKSAIQKFLRWAPRDYKGVSVKIVGYDQEGGYVARKKRLDTIQSGSADVLIFSYHQFARDHEEILQHIENFIVIFDEIQTVKSRTQKLLYPSAVKVSLKALYVWGLSATPIMNKLEELYSIMSVIRPGMFGDYDHFRKVYYKLELNEKLKFYEFTGYQNLQQLMLLMRPFYIRRPAEAFDHLLPRVVPQIYMCDMDHSQRSVYQQIKEKYFPGDSEMRARRLTPLASLTYAQMVSDAPQALSQEYTPESSKWDELHRILTEDVVDEKVIIFAKFERTISFLGGKLEAAGIPYVRITGKENPLERENNKLEFLNPEGRKIILINEAGGDSIDLYSAGILIFYGLPWSYGQFIQVIGRARRRGSKHARLLVVLLMNRGTIDEHVFKVLRLKENLVENTFGLDSESALRTEEERAEENTLRTLFDSIRDGNDS